MYLVFDLDATLGDFVSVWRILCTLRQSRFFADSNPASVKPFPTVSFQKKIDLAYNKFVISLAENEVSKEPLGLFRPGIFKLFEKVVRLKRSGACRGVIIYSNNSSIAILELVRDIFHQVFNYKVFDDLIHLRHEFRTRIDGTIDTRKNWNELQRILVSGLCKAPSTISVSEVKFFDDQIHDDLVEKLGSNYVHVQPYIFKVNMSSMVSIIKKILADTNLLLDADFLPYVGSCMSAVNTLEKYFASIEGDYVPSLSRPSAKDLGIELMLNALKVPGRLFRKSKKGGKRKIRPISMRCY